MANYKSHIAGGLVFSAAFAAASFVPIARFAEQAQLLSNWQATAAVFVIGMLFALLPDIDTNSKAQDIFL